MGVNPSSFRNRQHKKSFKMRGVFKRPVFAKNIAKRENYSEGNGVFVQSFYTSNILYNNMLHLYNYHKTQKPRKFYSFIGQKASQKFGANRIYLYFCIVKQQMTQR